MILLNQPFNGQLGEILRARIVAPYTRFTILSAFAKNSGVLRMKPTLEQFKANGGHIEAFIGVDAHGTSYEAALNLFKLCDALYIVHSENASTTFHSKVYMLSNDNNDAWMAVGSNNFTGGGLWTNFESAVYFDVNDENIECVNELNAVLDQYRDPEYPCTKLIETEFDLSDLLHDDYLRSEFHIRMGSHTERQNIALRHFGVQPGIAIPGIQRQPGDAIMRNRDGQNNVQAIVPIAAIDNDECMWFETRSLTGGSRNILDLSKLGTITRGNPDETRYQTNNAEFVLGGVAFFDVDPERTDIEKSITINYNGVDYRDCVIKFPDSDLRNGSWRIQLKGESTERQKIHKVGGTEWLRFKILVFEKIRTDYYVMSVLEEEQLNFLEEQSRFVATNGSAANSKKYGLL